MSFWACMNSIFHARQFFINSEHILDILRAKKFHQFFTWFQPFFHHQADFRKLQRPPESDSWGFHGGIPSSGTQGSPPNHYWQKNIFKPQNPKSHSQPSVHCNVNDLTNKNSNLLAVYCNYIIFCTMPLLLLLYYARHVWFCATLQTYYISQA